MTATTASGLDARLRARWARWLDRRIPAASSVTLDQRRIFIFPSRTGFFFGVCLLVMLVAAINYQNNMSFALTFLLANVFIVAVLHSYANLSGLTISAVGANEVFAHQDAAFKLRLAASERRGHYALRVGWPAPLEPTRRRRWLPGFLRKTPMRAAEELSLEQGEQLELKLHLPVGERGWFLPGRLRIETVYPIGLLRCWTWVDLDMRALVYPQPLAGPEPQGDDGDTPEGRQLSAGDEEFCGIREYREGDSLRGIYWKSLAKGQGLQSKAYASTTADARWLDWAHYPGLSQEQRLSVLCHQVLSYHSRELPYGLRLPDTELAQARGDRQREQALRALATYRLDAGESSDSAATRLEGAST